MHNNTFRKWARTSIATFLLMSFALISGCGKTAENTEVKNTEPETQPAVIEETTVAEPATESHAGMAKSPYTGLWVDEKIASQRPVACMIENTKATLPQYGLNSADIIYECVIEGGITRFMAVFQDYEHVVRYGNFRSCRPAFIPLAQECNAVYFHCGGSKEGLEILKSGILDHINFQDYTASQHDYIDPNRKAPHHIYMQGEKTEDVLAAYKMNTTLPADYTGRFLFAEDGTAADMSGGETCVVCDPYFYECKPYFVYNETDHKYYRNEYGKEQVDGNTGEQIGVTNIIIQNTTSQYDADKYYVYMHYTEGGTGWYVSDGKMIPITWKKKSDTAVPVYYDEKGNELKLNPGNTWVCISQKQYAKDNLFWSSLEEFKNH